MDDERMTEEESKKILMYSKDIIVPLMKHLYKEGITAPDELLSCCTNVLMGSLMLIMKQLSKEEQKVFIELVNRTMLENLTHEEEK
jgi:hypothetical protein